MKKLNIAIITKLVSPTVTNEFVPELESRGHQVTCIDISSVPMINFAEDPLVTSLCNYDIVYYRTGLTPEGCIYLENILKKFNIKLLNFHFSLHPFAHYKTYEALLANQGGLLIPETLARGGLQTYANAASVLGSTFVAKPNLGTQGNGVKLINNEVELTEYIENSKDFGILLQEFIPHECEYRVHTVGGKTVAMYKRVPAAGDFRSNISTGGEMQPVEKDLQTELTNLAEKAAALFDFEIMAVDFMRHKETGAFYFTEINLNPGWEIADKNATGIDLSSVTADYFES